MGGASLQKLTTNAWFAGSVALALLGILYVMNLRGLSLSKWLNDLGGVGTIVGTLALCALSYFTIRRHGSLLRISDFTAPSNDWHLITAFGTICYSLIGLDLASVMGDEIRNPKRDLPGAVLIGGLLSGFIYVSATASLLVAVPKERIGVLEGILQGVSSMAEGIGLTNFIPVVALLMAVAILGTASAWFGGAARLPFVAGLDRYLPSSFGELHPVYGTPYVSLNVFAVISCLLIVVSLLGGTVAEGFLVLLNLASALLLISFGYVFAALLKRALDQTQPVFANRTYLIVNALSGLLCSCIGICVAFIPSSQVTLLWLYEFKLLFGTAVIFGAAYYFYRRAASSGNQGMPRIPRRA
jgi:amino acid transporter